jgi:hypothetical protein
VSFARSTQLGRKIARQIRRPEQTAFAPKRFFHSDALAATTAFHDFEFVDRATVFVQHEEHSRRDLEDPVDSLTSIDGFSKIQLRRSNIAAARANGLSMSAR